MRCRVGDLAVIVESECGHDGKMVTVLQLVKQNAPTVSRSGEVRTDTIWRIDRPLADWEGTVDYFCPDSQLRPIRDPGDDAKDETLEWLPVPQPVVA